jgi:hypothetical protein
MYCIFYDRTYRSGGGVSNWLAMAVIKLPLKLRRSRSICREWRMSQRTINSMNNASEKGINGHPINYFLPVLLPSDATSNDH